MPSSAKPSGPFHSKVSVRPRSERRDLMIEVGEAFRFASGEAR